jgi:two-component system CheB/CheR fusion protein
MYVQDTGVGIDADMAHHLFEPFSQAPQAIDRSRGGLGLGLAMTKGLVELHGGSVTISSEGPGRGTTVTVCLPLDTSPASAEVVAVESRPQRRRRVVVIEDNKDAADTLKEALLMNGHEVEAAYDGPSGIELVRNFHPEIVICDIGLPTMDGYEVAKTLRADDASRGVYFVALTGYAMPKDLERATAAGFDHHLTKPVSLDVLNRLISDAPSTPRSPGSPDRT